jgi:hypothetical protein
MCGPLYRLSQSDTQLDELPEGPGPAANEYSHRTSGSSPDLRAEDAPRSEFRRQLVLKPGRLTRHRLSDRVSANTRERPVLRLQFEDPVAQMPVVRCGGERGFSSVRETQDSRLVATQPVDNRAALCRRVSICAEGCLSGQLRVMPAGQKRLSIRVSDVA